MATKNGDISSAKGTFNLFDSGVIVVATLAVLGFFMQKSGHAGVNAAIQSSGPINIDIMITGVKTLDTNLFVPGNSGAITIRNQPVNPPMKIVKVQHWPKQVTLLSADGKKAMSVPDLSNPIAHDFLITFEAPADATADGYVYSGNKVKVGNPVDIESFKYRIPGVIADVRKSGDPEPKVAIPGAATH